MTIHLVQHIKYELRWIAGIITHLMFRLFTRVLCCKSSYQLWNNVHTMINPSHLKLFVLYHSIVLWLTLLEARIKCSRKFRIHAWAQENVYSHLFAVYTVEIVLRIIGLGFICYFRSALNMYVTAHWSCLPIHSIRLSELYSPPYLYRCDFLVILVSVIAQFLELHPALRYATLVRPLKLLRSAKYIMNHRV